MRFGHCDLQVSNGSVLKTGRRIPINRMARTPVDLTVSSRILRSKHLFTRTVSSAPGPPTGLCV